MDLSGFEQPGFGAESGVATLPTSRQVQPSKATGGGLLGSIAHTLVTPFIRTGEDVSNAIGNAEVNVAHALGLGKNARTMTNTQQFGNIPVIGSMAHNDTLPEFLGNAAQVGSYALPVTKVAEGAGLLDKTVAGALTGARIGTVAGAGQAAANDQNIIGGATSGALAGGATGGALPLGSKILRGLIGKSTSAATSKVASAATPSIGQKIGDLLEKTGQEAEARTGGYAAGSKVAGQQLNSAASNKIAQTLQNEGITALGAPEKLSQVGEKLNTYNATRNGLMATHDASLTQADKAALQDAFHHALAEQAGGTSPTVMSHATTFLNEVLQKGKISDLGAYKTSLDNNAINWARNPASVEPGQQLAAKAMRGVIKNFLETKVPGLAELNAKATALQTAEGALMNASGRLNSLATGGEGIWGRLLSGPIAEKVKAGLARGAQTAGKALGGTAEPTPIEGEVVNQAVPITTQRTTTNIPEAQVIAQNIGKTGQKAAINVGATLPSALSLSGNRPQDNATSQYGTSSLETTSASPTSQTNSQNSTSQYPEANMLYDIERDPKNASTYETLYKTLNPTPTANSLDNLTTNQKNQLTGSQNAIAALQGYLAQIQQLAGKMTGPLGGTVGALLGRYGQGGIEAANAYALESSAADVATQVAAGLSPTGRAQQGLINQVKESLPKVTDSPEAAQAKVSQIVARLQAVMQTEATPLSTFINPTNTGGSDIGNQLGDLLATQGGQ